MDDNNASKIQENLQQSVVEMLTARLSSGEITQERAKEIAQHVLTSLPENISYQKLMEILPTLDDHFEELSATVLPIVLEYEKQMKTLINQKIQQLLKENKLDQALDIAKKAIEFEKSLT